MTANVVVVAIAIAAMTWACKDAPETPAPAVDVNAAGAGVPHAAETTTSQAAGNDPGSLAGRVDAAVPPKRRDADSGEDGVDDDAEDDAKDNTDDDVFDPEGAPKDDVGESAPRAAGDPVTEQCNRILDRAWALMKPALRRLKVPATARVEADFRGMRTENSSWTAAESKGFLDRCRALSAKKRRCIDKAEHPVSGLYACDVLFSGPRNMRPYPPTVYDHVTLVRPALVPRDQRAARLAQLAGRWVNDDPDGFERRWTVAEDGSGREVVTFDGGREKKTAFTLAIKRDLRLVRRERGAPPELWTLFVPPTTTATADSHADASAPPAISTFYASASGYGAFPITTPTAFVVDHFGEFVFWEGPRDGKPRDCDVVSATGLQARGTCTNSATAFTAKWRFAQQQKRDGSPRHVEATWEWHGDHLVDSRLIRRGRFVRK